MSLEGVSECEAVIVNDGKEDITDRTTDETAIVTDVSPPPAKKAKFTDERLTVRFVKTSANAHAPTYGSTAAAGADLYSAENVTVPAKGKYCVSTDLQVELPFGYYGRVAPRSGLAAKNFIDVGAGVVDSDYRGVLKVLLFNFSDQDFEVKVGDRIAQFICERIAHCNYEEVQSLEETQRGAGGFGSTGV